MILGCLVPFHAAHPAVAHQLRVTVDSFLAHVDRNICPHLVIVDDCSPRWPESDAYFAHLESKKLATILRLGDPRTSYYHSKGRGGDQTSYGHGVAIMRGAELLRGLGCTHVWMLDSDCAVLDGGPWLTDALALFRHRGVVAVADYIGGAPSTHEKVMDDGDEVTLASDGTEITRYPKGRLPCHAAVVMAGFPHFSCALVDLNMLGELENGGVVNAPWYYRAMHTGARIGYYPFYQGRHVYHLGSGSTLFSRDRWQKGEYRGFGNAKDGDIRFGRRNEGSYQAGYLQLGIPSTEYLAWLETTVANAPLTTLVDLPREWLIEPTATPLVQTRFIRRAEPDDAKELAVLGCSTKEYGDHYVWIEDDKIIGAARLILVWPDEAGMMFYATEDHAWHAGMMVEIAVTYGPAWVAVEGPREIIQPIVDRRRFGANPTIDINDEIQTENLAESRLRLRFFVGRQPNWRAPGQGA